MAIRQIAWPALALGLLMLSACQPAEEMTDGLPPATQIANFGSLPRWSPDGQKLVFGGNGAQMGIWLYDRSGEGLTQVTDAGYPHLYDYRFSNGSEQIAFGGAGAAVENTSGIWVVGLNGADPVRWHTTGHSPCWMPDDEGLVFAENDPQSGTLGLFRLLFADTSLTRLTYGGIDPQYDSTGTQIAYREAFGENYQLKVMTPEGALTNILAQNCNHFCWTEGGNTLVFDYQSSEGAKISRVAANGGAILDVILGAVEPAAAANGRIAYHGVYGDLSQGIRAVDLNGENVQMISSEGYEPAITADATVIAYASNNGIWLVNL